MNPKNRRLAIEVEDYPMDYADVEGVIEDGYGAGTVMTRHLAQHSLFELWRETARGGKKERLAQRNLRQLF